MSDDLEAEFRTTPLARAADDLVRATEERAYAHELTEEELASVVARLRDLAERETDFDARQGMLASIGHIEPIFEQVEEDELNEPLRNSHLLAEAEAIYAEVSGDDPDPGETAADRAELRRRIEEGLDRIGALAAQGSSDEALAIGGLAESLGMVLSALDREDEREGRSGG
ncbi:MAG: hypothetical protein LBJ87_15900 [bacterium]|jgi:hypothetical protein|nr:hypothetical protein [bacterium]